jgi:hypothetical protein
MAFFTPPKKKKGGGRELQELINFTINIKKMNDINKYPPISSSPSGEVGRGIAAAIIIRVKQVT